MKPSPISTFLSFGFATSKNRNPPRKWAPALSGAYLLLLHPGPSAVQSPNFSYFTQPQNEPPPSAQVPQSTPFLEPVTVPQVQRYRRPRRLHAPEVRFQHAPGRLLP